jgi:TolB-like protein
MIGGVSARSATLVLVALLSASPASAAPAGGQGAKAREDAAAKRLKVAVLEIRPIAVEKPVAQLLSEVVLTQASRFKRLDVIGQSDVASMLGYEQQKKLLGCTDDSACMAEIGGALGADYVLVGTLGRIGSLLRADLKLVDAKRSRVVERFGESVDGGEDRLVAVVQRGVDELLSSIAGPAPSPPPATAAAPAPAARRISFNGRPLSPDQLQTIERLEAQGGGHLPDGEYFYDPLTGAAGRFGGPALAFLPVGLDLNGRAPANASGGGQGVLTGVFINGRELHPIDVAGLQELVGAVYPGRWWVDAQGNYGLEGGPAMGNLLYLAQARRAAGQAGGGAWSRRYEGVGGGSMNLAGDGSTTCVSTGGYTRCTGE